MTSRRRRSPLIAPLLALAVLGQACARDTRAAPGHLLVWIDTDAPSPSLLDVVRVEVMAPDGHVVDVRELPLDAAQLASGLGFTIVPLETGVPAGTLHVTAWQARDGRATPRPAESVEGWFALPMAPEVGAGEITILLGLDGVGAPTGSPASPATPESGHPPSRVGSWPGAQATPCTTAPGDGEVCIPGGAFWMGHPRAADLGLASGGDRRLVVLAPFLLDRHEVTVAAYRRDGKVFAGRWSGAYGTTNVKDYCVFTDAPGPHEDVPLNCVQWQHARQYCASRGGDLPSEAQLEYVSSAFGASLYPWGDDPPSCQDCVWGRAGANGAFADIAQQPGPCRPTTGSSRERSGASEPVTRASLGRDQLAVEGGVVQDLAGNLSEWARDSFTLLTSTCWKPRAPNLLTDPVCTAPSDVTSGPTYAVRGTSFYLQRNLAASAVRAGAVEGAHLDIGFRCMRPAH